MKRVEGRIETMNKKLKCFNSMALPYKGRKMTPEQKVEDHGLMFNAVICFSQIAMELGYGELWRLKEYSS